MKKIQLFYKMFIGYCLLLTCLCFYGWYQIGEFTNGLERTLQVNASYETDSESMSGSENTNNSEDEISFTKEEEYLFLDVGAYPEICNLSIEIAEKYAKFTSGDVDFKDIKSYFMEGSDILIALESYSSRRYDDHDDVLIEDMEFVSLQDVGDGKLLSRVTFVYVVIVDNEVKRFPSDYSIYFEEESKKITALAMN